MKSAIRDIKLAPIGRQKIEWVRKNMPILRGLEEEFKKTKPFAGKKISISLHLEAKSAYLAKVIAAGGAEVAVTGSNSLSTQDDVVAALVEDGISVYAWHNSTRQEYMEHLNLTVDFGPNIIIDDGGDLVQLLHTDRRDLLPGVLGGCEETTTGVLRNKAMERDGCLQFPMVAINDGYCKHLFDNRYGTGQSTWDAINSTTNLIAGGKDVVVIGYGWCGKGIAMRAKGLGASVTVCEIDPIKAIEAVMDGFKVMKMSEAAKIGDIFITAAGCNDVITGEHYKVMKNGAIFCNAGHFNIEINVDDLEKIAVEKKEQRKNIMGYKMPDGRWLNLLCEAALVNIAAGNGHAAEIMDLSFSLQALCARYIMNNYEKIGARVIDVPQEIDEKVARLKLKAWKIDIDTLTEEQKKYLNSWEE